MTHPDDHGPLATMGEAHAEWHRNSGNPIGLTVCPWDACDPQAAHDDPLFWEEFPEAVKCGNRKAHPEHDRDTGLGYHPDAAAVRACYAATHGWGIEVSPPKPPRVDWGLIPVGERGLGFYALPSLTGGQARFFRVERAKDGRWAGKTFVKGLASERLVPVADWADVLNRIAADPEAAGRLYATLATRCTRCNRLLTDGVSRERGMGPDCARKGGW